MGFFVFVIRSYTIQDNDSIVDTITEGRQYSRHEKSIYLELRKDKS